MSEDMKKHGMYHRTEVDEQHPENQKAGFLIHEPVD